MIDHRVFSYKSMKISFFVWIKIRRRTITIELSLMPHLRLPYPALWRAGSKIPLLADQFWWCRSGATDVRGFSDRLRLIRATRLDHILLGRAWHLSVSYLIRFWCWEVFLSVHDSQLALLRRCLGDDTSEDLSIWPIRKRIHIRFEISLPGGKCLNPEEFRVRVFSTPHQSGLCYAYDVSFVNEEQRHIFPLQPDSMTTLGNIVVALFPQHIMQNK